MPLKVGVMGAGAVGCWIGGRLAASGFDVVLVGRERTKAALDAEGMSLVELGGERTFLPHVAFSLEPEALADRDVTLCCVKSAQTESTGETLSRVLGRGAVVVSFQNGVGNAGVLQRVAPLQRVLGGIVGFNVLARGATFRRATSGPLVVQASSDRRAKDLATSLRASGFEVEEASDIVPTQWSKLVMNLANAVGALSGAPTKEILFVPGYRRVVRAIMSEALSVMRAAKIKPARLGAVPVRLFPSMLRLPTVLLRTVSRAQLAIDPEARSSMWQDLDQRRLTEVDYLNGEIVRLAASCGHAAPINARVVSLVHEVEAKRSGSPNYSPEALGRALAI